MTAPADVPTICSASAARQPVSASSASRAPMSQEPPMTPPAPSTSPTRMAGDPTRPARRANQGASRAISRQFAQDEATGRSALTGPAASRRPWRGRAAASSSGPGSSAVGPSRRVRRPSSTMARNRRQSSGCSSRVESASAPSMNWMRPRSGPATSGRSSPSAFAARPARRRPGRSVPRACADALLAVGGAEHDLLEPAVGGEHRDDALEEDGEALPRRGRSRAASASATSSLDALLEKRVDEQLLLGEAAVDRPDADPGAPRDLVHRHGEPALGEGLGGGGEDPRPVALGVAAQAALRLARRGGVGAHGLERTRKRR